MDVLLRIVHEIHRRSLWQVLGIYLAGSWIALQVVDQVTEAAGLPDWTPGLAFVLLLILLPVVLATAFVQEGMPGRPEGPTPSPEEGGRAATAVEGLGSPVALQHRVFTWRHALLGAIGMFTLLGLSVFGYFVMWTSGIGPMGNLQAQGVLTEGEPVVLAEIQNRTDDPDLGLILTGALRVDLEQSTAITLLSGDALEAALVRMGRDPSATLTPALAREIALREGIGAVIEGEVGSVGPSFVLTARVVASSGGDAVASFRQTAADEDALLDALAKLSREIRERVGESLASINKTPRLSQVTTASLEALRKYTEAQRLMDLSTENLNRAIPLLEEAVALDTAFAMGYRTLSVRYSNASRPAESRAAAIEAHRFLDRLPRLERDLTTAWFQQAVERDDEAAELTYRNILDYAPRDRPTRINLAYVLSIREERYAEALEVLKAGGAEEGDLGLRGYLNLFWGQMHLGDHDAARRTLALMVETGGFATSLTFGPYAALARRSGSVDEAHAWADSLEADGQRSTAHDIRWGSDFRVGRVSEAVGHMTERIALQEREGLGRASQESRVFAAVTVLQTDTTRALVLLRQVERDVARLDPDSLILNRLAWAYWQAGSSDGVQRVAALARAYPGHVEELGGQSVEYLRLLSAVLGSEYDLPAYDAVESTSVGSGAQRRERAEMAYGAGRLDEAASHYEAIFAVPGWNQLDDLWAPLYHERVAQIYEELGNGAKAAEHYRAFAEMWSGADPDVQPRVKHARDKAAALGGVS